LAVLMIPIEFLRHGYGRFDAGKAIGPVRWPHADLLWLHSGRVELTIGDAPAQTLRHGQGVLIHPDTPFNGHALTRTTRASIQHFRINTKCKPDRLPEPLKRFRHTSPGYTRYEARDAEMLDDMIDHAMHLASLTDSPMIRSLRLAQLTLILGQLELDEPAQPMPVPHRDRLGELMDQIRQHPERAWSLQQMADHVGVSASHFRALFRVQVGVSPGQFQQQARMAEAARLLRHSDGPIKHIARTLGYRDLSHFYRQFHAAHTQTPHAYRLAHRPIA
jgi:AraC-like DNA-binding protein